VVEGLSIPYGELFATDGFIAIKLPAELMEFRPVNDSLLGAIVPICTWAAWASPWATVQVPFCAEIDADVAVLRTRRLDHQLFVYVWLDVTYLHVRENRQVVSKAVVIATGLRVDGHREVLGLDVGDSENETFWREFLTDLNDAVWQVSAW
jgi:hypothetical protein